MSKKQFEEPKIKCESFSVQEKREEDIEVLK